MSSHATLTRIRGPRIADNVVIKNESLISTRYFYAEGCRVQHADTHTPSFLGGGWSMLIDATWQPSVRHAVSMTGGATISAAARLNRQPDSSASAQSKPCSLWQQSFVSNKGRYRAVFKAWVCGRPLAGIAGSNPAWGMDVCVLCMPSVVR